MCSRIPGVGGWGQRGVDGEGEGGAVLADMARCGVPVWVGSRVTPGFAWEVLRFAQE